MTDHAFLTRDGRHICAPYREQLAQLIPHAKPLTHNGTEYLVFPNGHTETKLARNLGFYIPSPVLTTYDWCGQKPWDVQRTTATLLVEEKRAYVLSTMGTGKTRSVLYAFDYLKKQGRARRLLVSATLSTLEPTWGNEVFTHFPHLRFRVLYGSKAKRLKLLAEDADVYIVNHHGMALLQKELIAKGFDCVAIDEVALLRNKKTDLWDAHNAVLEGSPGCWAWALTASPTPLAPTDAWAQVKLLTPGRVPRTFSAFREQTMQKVSTFRYVARENALEIVHQAMQPSVRFTRDDIAELPPTSYVDRKVDLDPDAAKAYRMLHDKMVMLTDKGQSITAVNEGVLQSKLLQVACGFIYTDAVNGQKTVYRLPATGRLRALDDLIAETDEKFIVFVPFVHALEGVAEHLRKQGHEIDVVHGGVPQGRRNMIFNGLQNGKVLRGVVAHPQCMAHGLTLTAANLIAWYSPTQSLEIYEQANARIIRPGQTRKTIIGHLFGTAVERATYTRLKQRGKMQGVLLEMFRQQELDL